MASHLLTSAQKDILNKENPDFQSMGAGDKLDELFTNSPVIVKIVIDGDYHTTAKSAVIPCDFQLTEVIVDSQATSSSGTITVRKSTTAITDAIIMAADHVVTRAGTIDDAQATILTTDSINVITHAAGDRGIVTLMGYRV